MSRSPTTLSGGNTVSSDGVGDTQLVYCPTMSVGDDCLSGGAAAHLLEDIISFSSFFFSGYSMG